MDFNEELSESLKLAFQNISTNGLQDFLKLFRFDNKDSKDLLRLVQEDADVVWYPGCGTDISPCTVLGEKAFEKKNKIEAKDKKIYIFTDPGTEDPDDDDESLNYCLQSFGQGERIYDLTIKDSGMTDYVETESYTAERIHFENESKNLITGYYITLVRNSFEYQIIYLKLTMENFLLDIIRVFNIKIKWMFYINMNKGYDFIKSFVDYNIDFPEWVCANREFQYGITDYADMEFMMDGSNYMYDHYNERAKFGKMKKPNNL